MFMMKIFMLIVFILFMMVFNSMVMFYSNMYYFVGLLMFFLCSYMKSGYWFMISGYSGCDMYSFVMIWLTIWVIGLMYMSLFNESYTLVSLVVFGLTGMILLMFFGVYNLLLMYLFFEVSLIPTFFIVVFWGNNLDRLEASFYLFMYMMFISLPLLIYLMSLYKYNCSLDMNILSTLELNLYEKGVLWWDFIIIFGAFFIKLPIYLFHVWLPKAHVEAPVYGSMLLAAVLLKLGGYGLLRIMIMFLVSCIKYGFMVMSVSLIGSVYIGMVCLVQVDMKSMVAYSSVVHMNFMLCSLFTLVKISVIGALIIMISHGLCSSGLFYMVNMYYKRSFSRLIVLNKGYNNIMPSVSIWWFLICCSNFSFPFSTNFFGEIFMIMSLVSWGSVMIMFIFLVGMLSGAYSLYLFSIVNHGEIYNESMINSGELVEYLCMMIHYIPLLLMMFNLFFYY